MKNDLDYKIAKPEPILSNFVESFGMVSNRSNSHKKMIVLPDGRLDLLFFQSEKSPLQVRLTGIETRAKEIVLPPKTVVFAAHFKLLAADYIFRKSVSNLLNEAEILPSNFWSLQIQSFEDFDVFRHNISQKIKSFLPKEIDSRKQQLFNLIYSSNGVLTVKEVSKKAYWSSRPINYYFNRQFGISLKAYCNILRFSASFKQLSEGKLFPEDAFTDQNHFIKSVKRYAGITPKALSKNKKGLFINISVQRNFKD